MYKTPAEAKTLAMGLKEKLASVANRDIAVFPTYVALHAVSEALKGSTIAWGAQNAHWEKQGAFTGEISVSTLADIGCRYVILGHSERRQFFGETDAAVNKRALGALSAGVTPIVCIGETLAEREANQTFAVIETQMKGSLAGLPNAGAGVVIAYEPVWAIGTGKTATPEQAQEVHAFVRKLFASMYGAPAADAVRILYGGSVKPDNMTALMAKPDIDGGLVGGASLEVDSFAKIVQYQG